MSMNPNKLAFMRQTEFIPINAFTGLGAEPTITTTADASITALGLSDAANDAALANATTGYTGITGVQPGRSWGVGNAVLSEISTFGLAGLLMNTASYDVAHLMQIPPHWDRNFPIRVRVVWTSAAASSGAKRVTWKVMTKTLAFGTTVLAAAATVLSTLIVEQTPSGTAYILEATNKGVIDKTTLTATMTHLAFLVELQALTSFADDKWLIGVEFEYTPRFGRGRNQREARSWEDYQFGT